MICSVKAREKQQGLALFITFVILIIIGIGALSTSDAAILEQKMAMSYHEDVQCIHAADSATKIAIQNVVVVNQALQQEQTLRYTDIIPTTKSTPTTTRLSYLKSAIPAGYSIDAGIAEKHFVAIAEADGAGVSTCNLTVGFSRLTPADSVAATK